MRPRIVVVGDVLLDVDVETDAVRMVPDAVAPVLTERARRERPGGAALASRLAARTGDVDVTLVAAFASDHAGQRVQELVGNHVDIIALPCRGETPVKTRLRSHGQTVARLDAGTSGVSIDEIPLEVRTVLDRATAILVSDYGGAVTAHPVMRDLLSRSARRRPMVWDPHPRGAPPVPGVLLVTPNEAETTSWSGLPSSGGLIDVSRQASRLVARWEARCVAVTRGAKGALLCTGEGSTSVFPAPTTATGDACGAGDCFASAAVSALARGALPSEAVSAAVAAATGFVAGGGVGAADDDMPARPALVARAAEQVVADVRARGGTVVATGGCFDLLHAGHIQTLAAARSLGDCLVVCLNSDRSVRRLKGAGRPIQSERDRALVLKAIREVDAVVVFDEDTPERVLSHLRPDIWVKGGDYAGADLPEAQTLREWGGEVVTVPYLDGHSTSALLRLVGS